MASVSGKHQARGPHIAVFGTGFRNAEGRAGIVKADGDLKITPFIRSFHTIQP